MYKVIGLAIALAVSVTVFILVGTHRAPAPQPVAAAPSQANPKPAETGTCPFPRIARRLSDKERLNVVAIGSSSTEGAGASSPSKTYPAQLNAHLSTAFPGAGIQVHNRGISGEVAAQNLTRFQKDIFALDADLVVWQVGTNDALRNVSFEEFAQVIESGVSQLREHQIDVALLDLQYLGEGHEQLARYQGGIERLAERLRVERIPRWGLMKGLVESGQYALADLVTKDGLHTTDITYEQTAAYTARLIAKNCAAKASH